MRSQQAQWRPCRLVPKALRPAADWLDDYRELWEVSLDRLEEYLAGLQRAALPPKPPRQRHRSPKSNPTRRRKP